ncbi:MAG: caspase family protein, partial [Pseudomonadota bacterium]
MAYIEDRDYALVVGIDDYPRFGRNGRNLRGAIRDAKSFARWLTDRQTGGGLPDDHCKLVTSEGNPLVLGKTTIDNGLEEIWQQVIDNGGGRRLYLFFSGHGQIVDGQGSFRYEQTLCLPNWSLTRPNEAIITDSYQTSAQHCMPFEEIVAFLDCCRVPTVRVRGDNTSVNCQRPQAGHETIRRVVFYAGEPGTRVFEGEAVLDGDDIADEPIVHGHFTNALVNGLQQGSDRDGGGISAADLFEHLEYWAPRIAEKAGHNQQPRSEPLEPPDDMVFGKAVVG